jgi:hypothetical protein
MDNGWDTPIAIQNIYKLIGLPGIEYHAEVLDWNGFKAVQRAFIEAGVPDIEARPSTPAAPGQLRAGCSPDCWFDCKPSPSFTSSRPRALVGTCSA